MWRRVENLVIIILSIIRLTCTNKEDDRRRLIVPKNEMKRSKEYLELQPTISKMGTGESFPFSAAMLFGCCN